MTDEILNENPEETTPSVSDDVPNENTEETIEEVGSDEDLKEKLKKRLELELGLPLTPQLGKQVEQSFEDNVILIEDFPVQNIRTLKIDDKIFTEEDYILDEKEGCIYLKENHKGFLYLEYCYCLPKSEYEPLLDLMVEYESDNSWNKDASSIKENNVTVSYDTSVGKGARIQTMIADLRNRYHCYVEMI